MKRALLFLCVTLGGCICGDLDRAYADLEARADAGTPEPEDGGLDAGVRDAGPVDAGAPDAGGLDSGADDAGPMDAGSTDAGGMDDGGMCTPQGGPCSAANPGVCCGPVLCCAANSNNTVFRCEISTALPGGFLCLN